MFGKVKTFLNFVAYSLHLKIVKKALLNDLVKSQDLNSLERHLIFFYLFSNELDFSVSPILINYFKDFQKDTKLFFDVSTLGIENIKDLENHLELLIPTDDRKLNGAFFTPEFIIDFIIKEIQPKEDERNLDPSCGCGAFLIGLTEYYKINFSKSIRSIVKENIWGADILEYNVQRTKLLLAIYALQNGEILEEQDFNIHHFDSLKTKWDHKFDVVVGNPPYVKFQDLSSEYRAYLSKNWETVEGGTFNLYFAFFELGYTLLSKNGRLGYITPNNYFTSLAGESIRKFFQQKKCVTRIIDFTHRKIFDAQTYTAITFLTNHENEAIKFDRILEEYSPMEFLANVNGSLNYVKELNVKKWRLLKTEEQNNIKIIETIGTPIRKLFEICVGIATLKDEVFFIDGSIEKDGFFLKTNDFGTFQIEKEVTRPVYKISDFKSESETEYNTRRVIFPYDIKENVAVPLNENEFKKKYPKCYEYLLSQKEILQCRDKGKVNFQPFYSWGRTQGITKKGKKILNPTFSLNPRFLLVNDEDAYFTNGYGTYFKKQKEDLFIEELNPIANIENIDVVQKIFNSYLMHYYITKTSVSIEGGYSCYQKNFIENFSIPNFSLYEIETLRSLSRHEDIDKFLIDKYQLKIPLPNRLS